MRRRVILFIIVAFTVSSWNIQRTAKLRCFKLHSSNVKTPLQVNAADKIISTVFSIKPLFNIAAAGARKSMINQGLQIGVDWSQNVASIESKMSELKSEYNKIITSSIEYPDYFLKPFHAYDDGNLSWKAAMEVESAALTVHAHIFTPPGKKRELRQDGDFTLRDNFHIKMKEVFKELNFNPRSILDLGCSTGLSTLKLHASFPSAKITGLDLSAYYLAVAKLHLQNLSMPSMLAPTPSTALSHVEYIHGLAEDTGLTTGQMNMVTMSLVAHELPTFAFRDIAAEAYRILPKNGVFAIMDMNPESSSFQTFASNPFAFAAFKSTEPWIQEYVNMDMKNVLEKQCGFKSVVIKENSPRHRTVVAIK